VISGLFSTMFFSDRGLKSNRSALRPGSASSAFAKALLLETNRMQVLAFPGIIPVGTSRVKLGYLLDYSASRALFSSPHRRRRLAGWHCAMP